MKKTKLLTGLLVGVALGVAGCNEWGVGRQVVSLCGGGWRFSKDPSCSLAAAPVEFDDSKWQAVEVPHDWAISGPFDPEAHGGSGKLPWRGVGWYRREMVIPADLLKAVRSGAALWLEFDGVMARPEVYVNGAFAGGWNYGYMSFRVDVAPHVKEGVNVLAVRADTRDHHSRWYPGAGIYRAVRLVAAPAVHIVPGTEFVTTPGVAKQSAAVRVAFEVTNRLDGAVSATPRVCLRAPDGRVVAQDASAAKIPAKGRTTCVFDFEVRDPQLWDVTAPNLYTASLEVNDGTSRAGDAVPVRFGIRVAEFTADDGFHLNGRRVQLNGVDLHSDMGPLGMAFNRSVMKRQLLIMKEMGANALRTSHNACDPQVLELCDELGIVVWNECFDKWDGTSGRRGNERLEDYVVENLQAFVRRDRNHPSVVVWSIGNEIAPNGWDWSGKNPKAQDGMSAERFRLFRDKMRELDATRPVGIGCCHANAVDTGMFAELDLSGWNYRAMYRIVKARHPDKPVVYSESASALSSYGAFEQPPAGSKTDYDVANREVGAYEHNAAPWSDIADVEFARMEEDRYCAGEFVWTGIDYLGEPTPYIHEGQFPMMKDLAKSELARSSYFGIADLMGIPKERYWLYRAHWNRAARTVHISPHWNWKGREGQKTPVYVYTDGDEAELFLNGRSLGRRRKGESQRFENLAAGKPVDASSSEERDGRVNAPAFAVDGQNDSRWCANGDRKGEWWQVDLGRARTFRSVLVAGERGDDNYAWTILVSDDGKAWREYAKKPLGEKQSFDSAKTAMRFSQGTTARFVRVVFDDLKAGCWASIREVVVSESADAFRLNPYYDVCDRYRLRWFDVPYEPGELKAVAYRNGSVIGEAVVRTAEKPVAVKLTAEQTELPGDGETCVFVQVDVVDAKGTRDPWAKNRVSFKLSGPGRILAVGNGDPRAHEAFTEVASHPLYFGKAVAVVRRDKGSTGPIVLTASVDGLAPASVELK
ncbi:MAG: glycoside hydrolase family 2 TIM barrel-domain containing protein [Kiritimatiellia bacterium]